MLGGRSKRLEVSGMLDIAGILGGIFFKVLRKQFDEGRNRFTKYFLQAIKLSAALRDMLPITVQYEKAGEVRTFEEDDLKRLLLEGTQSEVVSLSNYLRDVKEERLHDHLEVSLSGLKEGVYQAIDDMTLEDAQDSGTVRELIKVLNRLIRRVGTGADEKFVGELLCTVLLNKFGDSGLEIAKSVWLPVIKEISPDIGDGFSLALEEAGLSLLEEVAVPSEQVIASLKEDWQEFLDQWTEEDIADIDVEGGGYTLEVISPPTKVKVFSHIRFALREGIDEVDKFIQSLRDFINDVVDATEGEESKKVIFKRAVAETLLLALRDAKMADEGIPSDVFDLSLDRAKTFAADMGLKPEFSAVLRKMLIAQAIKEILIKQLLGG